MGAFKDYIQSLKDRVKEKGDISELEIIRFIYIDLGKKMNFDLNYTFGNRKEKEYIYKQSSNSKKFDEFFEKGEIICRNLAIMLDIILREFGIDSMVVYSNSRKQLKHVFNIIRLKDGRIIKIDLEEDLEYIKTFSKTKNFGVQDNNEDLSFSLDIISEEELAKMDKTTAEYIPWGFYLDNMIKIFKFATKGMTVSQRLQNILDNLDVYVKDIKLGYRERILYHEAFLKNIFTDEELKRIFLINCYRANGEEKEYTSCIILDLERTGDKEIYLYSNRIGRYQRIGMDEFRHEIEHGLVPMSFEKLIKKSLKEYYKDKIE